MAKCIYCEKTQEELGGIQYVRFPETKYLLCYWCCEKLAGEKFFKILPEKLNTLQTNKKKINNNLRRLIYERDNYNCRYCGSHKNLTLDHVIPESVGGETNEENLVTACRDCNIKKRARTPEESDMILLAGD